MIIPKVPPPEEVVRVSGVCEWTDPGEPPIFVAVLPDHVEGFWYLSDVYLCRSDKHGVAGDVHAVVGTRHIQLMPDADGTYLDGTTRFWPAIGWVGERYVEIFPQDLLPAGVQMACLVTFTRSMRPT